MKEHTAINHPAFDEQGKDGMRYHYRNVFRQDSSDESRKEGAARVSHYVDPASCDSALGISSSVIFDPATLGQAKAFNDIYCAEYREKFAELLRLLHADLQSAVAAVATAPAETAT